MQPPAMQPQGTTTGDIRRFRWGNRCEILEATSAELGGPATLPGAVSHSATLAQSGPAPVSRAVAGYIRLRVVLDVLHLDHPRVVASVVSRREICCNLQLRVLLPLCCHLLCMLQRS